MLAAVLVLGLPVAVYVALCGNKVLVVPCLAAALGMAVAARAGTLWAIAVRRAPMPDLTPEHVLPAQVDAFHAAQEDERPAVLAGACLAVALAGACLAAAASGAPVSLGSAWGICTLPLLAWMLFRGGVDTDAD